MELLIRLALSYLGVPYKWGGSNPVEGFDCSGFVQEILAAAGIDPIGDQSAQALFNELQKNSPQRGAAQCGSIVFYGKSVTEISHVAWALNPYQIIEAGGGDHLTLTRDDAAKKSACIRVRLMDRRKDRVAIVHPSYARIGVP